MSRVGIDSDLRCGRPELFPREWVVSEDDSFLVGNKPAGASLLPQAESGVSFLERARESRKEELVTVPQVDQRSSGLVLLAKSPGAQRGLVHAMEEARQCTRTYALVVVGESVPQTMVLRDRRGRKAQLRFRLLSAQAGRRLVQAEVVGGGPGTLREGLVRQRVAVPGMDRGEPAWRAMVQLLGVKLYSAELSLEHATPVEQELLACVGGGFSALSSRLSDSLHRRHFLYRAKDVDAFRLVHGEGDGIPGVELDVYGEFGVLQLREGGLVDAEDEVIAAVRDLGFRGIYIKRRPKTSSRVSPEEQRRRAPDEPAFGEKTPEGYSVQEHGVSYPVALGGGLSTGIFLDQRCNRGRMKELAEGTRFLNLFAYTGAFTVAAKAGGARSATTVDLSGVALGRAKSAVLGLGALPGPERFVKADVFEWLQRAPDESFDLIVCDPPTFARSKKRTWKSGRDWVKLTQQLLRVSAPGGRLLLCSNDRRMIPKDFVGFVEVAFSQAGLRATEDAIVKLPAPPEYPPDPQQGAHLKTLLVTKP